MAARAAGLGLWPARVIGGEPPPARRGSREALPARPQGEVCNQGSARAELSVPWMKTFPTTAESSSTLPIRSGEELKAAPCSGVPSRPGQGFPLEGALLGTCQPLYLH